MSIQAREGRGAAGSELLVARVGRRMSQPVLSERIGTDQAILSKLERGLYWPRSYELIERLAELYGVRFGDVAQWIHDARQAARREDPDSVGAHAGTQEEDPVTPEEAS